MRRMVGWLWLNHRVVSKGKLVGCMEIHGERAGSYWF